MSHPYQLHHRHSPSLQSCGPTIGELPLPMTSETSPTTASTRHLLSHYPQPSSMHSLPPPTSLSSSLSEIPPSNAFLPNINIALPPPPSSLPPSATPTEDPETLVHHGAMRHSSGVRQSSQPRSSPHGGGGGGGMFSLLSRETSDATDPAAPPSWIVEEALASSKSAEGLLGASTTSPLFTPSPNINLPGSSHSDDTSHALTDQLLMFLNTQADHKSSVGQPSSNNSGIPQSDSAALRHHKSSTMLDPAIKSAAWLDRLMSGSTQDVFSDGNPFGRQPHGGVFRPASGGPMRDVFSDFPGGPGDPSEQPPSPLQKFHSWQQGTLTVAGPDPASRMTSEQARHQHAVYSGGPYPRSAMDHATMQGALASGQLDGPPGGLRDILGMLADKSGRGRSSSLPQADQPTSPMMPPHFPPSGNALRVPGRSPWETPVTHSPCLDSPSLAVCVDYRRQQIADGVTRSADELGTSPSNNYRSSTSPPPPPRSRRAPAKGWWKTEVCKFWKEGTGCRNGANCRWAHGDNELRRVDCEPFPNDTPPPESQQNPSFQMSPALQATLPPDWTASHERGPSSSSLQMLDPLPHPSVSPSLPIGANTSSGNESSLVSGNNTTSTNTKLVVLPIAYMLQAARRTRALDEIWTLVRMKNLPLLSLSENLLIASAPGIHADLEYWDDLISTLTGQDPEVRLANNSSPGVETATNRNHSTERCLLCGLQFEPQASPASKSPSVFGLLQQETSKTGIVSCDQCSQLAESKANFLGLFTSSSDSGDQQDRNSQSTAIWGFKLAQFMRLCEDGSWNVGNIIKKGQAVDPWVQHQRFLARLWVVLQASLRLADAASSISSPGTSTPQIQPQSAQGKPSNYQSVMVNEGMPLVEWTATAHQPALFGILLLSFFPVSRGSVPSSLATLTVSLESWRQQISAVSPAPKPRFLAPPSQSRGVNDKAASSPSYYSVSTAGTPSKRSTLSPVSPPTPFEVTGTGDSAAFVSPEQPHSACY
eukprot:Blabericola_migrator_1__9260@NODE_497_length_8018_cov_163_611747_g381_i0_p1_GENE_NODE_497_length_8018_cov_163_611747_g381_i0NODE_497_length_8018_cov_163_611747_g381_i0_p1_ORF_typecomplete_len992_score130_23zfCCCH/PF00642_24/1_8e07zfCCCH_4/PF18044_1/0_00092zf_CCCH_4/PF18345_1/0_004CxC4/PF18717_1/0_0051zfCCCH_3/PF15663_5/0_031Torus/PF16131_5/0_34_NODE_497_length_8018_cov_163_611747_g381_i016214596